MSLLFEDLFKRLNSELKRQADVSLAKANRASQFDIAKCIRCAQAKLCHVLSSLAAM